MTIHKIGDLVCRSTWHKKWNYKNPLIGIIDSVYEIKGSPTCYGIFWNDNFVSPKLYNDLDVQIYKHYLKNWITETWEKND